MSKLLKITERCDSFEDFKSKIEDVELLDKFDKECKYMEESETTLYDMFLNQDANIIKSKICEAIKDLDFFKTKSIFKLKVIIYIRENDYVDGFGFEVQKRHVDIDMLEVFDKALSSIDIDMRKNNSIKFYHRYFTSTTCEIPYNGKKLYISLPFKRE